MKLLFSLEYRASWGQDIRVDVDIKRRNGKIIHNTFPLNTHDGTNWLGECVLQDKDAVSFTYRYTVCSGDEVLRREWNGVPRTFPWDSLKTFRLEDYWKDIPHLSHLYSSAYSHCVAQTIPMDPQLIYFDKTLIFRVQAPQLRKGQCLAIIGDQPQLGQWVKEMALPMTRGGLHEWCISLSASGLKFPFEYKYVILDEQTGEFIDWEGGDNRHSPQNMVESGEVRVIWDERLKCPDEHWKTTGVVIPVFSLRTENSQGVGDFGDLKRMVDWAEKASMHVIQILPIYDTTQSGTWLDCYPYNSISIYALHPIYTDLTQLPKILDSDFMAQHYEKCAAANRLPQMDYEFAMSLKNDYLHRLYEQEGDVTVAGSHFQQFLQDNEQWLIPYSVFCYQRDNEHTSRFQDWSTLSVYDRNEVFSFAEKHFHEVYYYAWVQFILSIQLSETTRYARSHGVLLKGDIPIGISPSSVESWMEPQYFNMNSSAGAPPDDFSVNGQNWGFPTYNWEHIAADGYQWWINRFQKMAEYFDAYRIDHVLGFFRIWEIPQHSVHGLLGQFSPSLPMTVEEIEKYGLEWREDFFTHPYITDHVLRTLLPDNADVEEVRTKYLEAMGPDWYRMRPQFATQRQVEQYFQDCKDERQLHIRDVLYSLISDVLFIKDNKHEGMYHPRISVQNDFIYKALSSAEREAFNNLYSDYYYHRHNDFWYTEAMKKLPVLVEATNMLVCAEDLGMVPACVGPVLNQLKILSLEIQAMPKEYGVRFGRLENNPYRSVATIFTHDMPTLRGWWQEDPERTQHYYNEFLQKDGKAPEEMPGWLCEEVIARHLFSPSMLCLISLQDWLSMDENLRYPDPSYERINIPANPHHYWRYRMHLNIDDLLVADDLNARIRLLIERAGRK